MINANIFVIDDDSAVRDSLTLLLEAEGFSVEAFDCAEAFLADFRPIPHSCAIVDLRMPEMDGMTLQEELAKRGICLPLVFLTGHGDIPLSVRAVKAGAVDFLTKPVTGERLLHSIQAALRESQQSHSQEKGRATARQRLSALSEREREVMLLAIKGLPNKEIARHLGISHRTIEIHKTRIVQKSGAKSLFELAQIADTAGFRNIS